MNAQHDSTCRKREATTWQKVWLDEFPCDQSGEIPYPRMPIHALLTHTAKRFPNSAGCTLFGKVTTFGQLDDQAHRLATSLIAQGAGPGKHVGLLLPNIPEYLVALQAVWLTGATALQLSPLMVPEEVGHWLGITNCKIVITLDLLAPAVVRSLLHGPLQHLILTSLASRMDLWHGALYRFERMRRTGYLNLPDDPHHHRFEQLLRAEPLRKAVPIDPDHDVAVLAPTGGTTASPKSVMLTHRNLVANAFQLRERIGGPDGREGMLAVLPFFHVYGLSVSMLASWVKGSTMHLYPRFQAKPVLALIQEHKPELIPAVPAMLNALNQVMKGKEYDLSFVRFVIAGASALSAETRAEFEKHGVNEVVEGYGLTESSPVALVNLPGAGNHHGTLGLPLSDTEVRLVDSDTGLEVPDGSVGELVIRGPQVMKGYYHNPEATAAALRDGWLFTGDMARRDKEGYYALMDRKKDIIKTSGFLVYPAEVEEVVRHFPGVAEAAVVGVPDAQRGEMVKALVVASEGKHLDMAALNNYCRQHLGHHKRPRQIELVKELPKNFLGKVLRRKVREMAVADVASPTFTEPEA